VNADLIERVETTPDTVLTLIDGTKLIVEQPAAEVVSRIIDFRARVLAAAEELSSRPVARRTALRVVSNDDAIDDSSESHPDTDTKEQ
jgi:flagellar protein FlbD